MPSVVVRAPRPPRWKASKMRSRSAAGMPGPVSCTVTSASSPSTPCLHVDGAAVDVELDGVREQVEDDLLQAQLVGPDVVEARLDLQREGHVAAARRARGPWTSPCSRTATRETRRRLELHPPRLDLRQVEDLVDQLQQVAAGVADVAQVLLLPLVDVAEHALQEHVREPDHGVERRAQLVRHAREELGLVAARDLELERLALQRPEQPRVVDGHGGLAGERLHEVDDAVVEGARHGAPHDEGADDLALPQQRHREDGAPARLPQRVEVRVAGRLAQVGDLASARRSSRRGRRTSRPGGCASGAGGRRRSAARAMARAQVEQPRRGIEVEDGAALRRRRARRRG